MNEDLLDDALSSADEANKEESAQKAQETIDVNANVKNADITLTAAQESQILGLWNANPNSPPDLKTLTQALFGADYDGRSVQARAIKKALSKHSLRAKTSRDDERDIDLSEAHKAYIATNCKTMTALEMARVIFNNPHLHALQGEARAVSSYTKEVMPTPSFVPGAPSDIPTKAYEPPKNVPEASDKVNEFVHGMSKYDRDKLTPTQRKSLIMLVGYMRTYRFIAQMNNYTSENDRRLAEDAFVRATYDKPDLAQEEIDQYIEYANQVVDSFTVQRRKNQLSQQLEDITTSNDESLKITMSLVEAIGKAGTEYHQSLARQQKLLDDLKEKRSSRLSKQVKEHASVLNLVQTWRSEEGRKEMLAHAEREQALVAQEVNKLSSMSELKARILGLTKEEVLNG